MSKSYVDFYEKLKISPVAQDITDEVKHIRRRDALYRMLGIPPGWISGKDVIEFGPRSGFNSIHTASHLPNSYTLVEGNTYGIDAMQKLFREKSIEVSEIIHSRFENHVSSKKYDLVLCEGALPWQPNPQALLKHIAEFSKINGLVVITCIDSVCCLADLLIRLVCKKLVSKISSQDEKIEVLLEAMSPYLLSLKSMSRPHKDWILDNVIQPFEGRNLLSIPDAIATLKSNYSAYASSPHLVCDWSWYKSIVEDPSEYFNHLYEDTYWEYLHCFIDYQSKPEKGCKATNKKLHEHTHAIFQIVANSGETEEILTVSSEKVRIHLLEIAKVISGYKMETENKILGFASLLAQPNLSIQSFQWGDALGYFGRGQPYISFLRHS